MEEDIQRGSKKAFVLQLLLVLIGAVATAYGGYWYGNLPESIHTIEYEVSVERELKKGTFSDSKQLKMTFGDMELNELSRLSYKIANTSRKNLGKLQLHFEMPSDRKLPLFYDVDFPKNYPKKAVNLLTNMGHVGDVYVFEMDYLNRANSIWEGAITFHFYFDAKVPPEVILKAGTGGVVVKEYQEPYWPQSVWYIPTMIAMTSGLTVICFGAWGVFQSRRSARDFHEFEGALQRAYNYHREHERVDVDV